MKVDFHGRVVLITGGTRGIGAAMAQEFRDSGAELILTGTDQRRIEELNRTARDDGGKPVRYLAVDFSDGRSFQGFLEEIGSLERLDVCINNAGINRNNPITDVKDEDYVKLMQVDLHAPAVICRTVCRKMKAAGYGRIVNIASIWSLISKPGRSSYGAAKAGLAGLTRGVAADMAPFGVLVNTVSPGFTMTELTEANLSPAEIRELSVQVPLGRFAQPVEMARVVLFLASECNTYLTGQNIVVDGGFSVV